MAPGKQVERMSTALLCGASNGPTALHNCLVEGRKNAIALFSERVTSRRRAAAGVCSAACEVKDGEMGMNAVLGVEHGVAHVSLSHAGGSVVLRPRGLAARISSARIPLLARLECSAYVCRSMRNTTC